MFHSTMTTTSFHSGNCLHSFPLFTTTRVTLYYVISPECNTFFKTLFLNCLQSRKKSIFHYVHSKNFNICTRASIIWGSAKKGERELFAHSMFALVWRDESLFKTHSKSIQHEALHSLLRQPLNEPCR